MEFLNDSTVDIQPKVLINNSVATSGVKGSSQPITTTNFMVVPGNNEVVKIGYHKNEPDYCTGLKQKDWTEILSNKNFVLTTGSEQQAIYFETIKDTTQKEKLNLNSPPLHTTATTFAFVNFTLVLLLILLALMASVKFFFSKHLNQLMQSVVYYAESLKLYRDHNSTIDRMFLLANLIFVFSGGFFCYYLFTYFKPQLFEGQPIKLSCYCFAIILCMYLFKYLINKIFGFIMDYNRVFDEFLHNTFSYFKVMGLFLLPINCVLPFANESFRFPLIVIGLFIIFLLYFLSLFRASKIMLQKDILLFYWILYLCMVEFLPIMLLYKYFNTVV